MGVIQLSDAASAKLKELLAEANKDGLRVFIQGGGCAGFQYGFEFLEAVADDDFLSEEDGVKIAVDAASAQYLMGATLDYKEELLSSRFVINNPNATTHCGCGSSFA